MEAIRKFLSKSLLLLTLIQLALNISYYTPYQITSNTIYDYFSISFYMSLVVFVICLIISIQSSRVLPCITLAFGQVLMVPIYHIFSKNEVANTNIQIAIAILLLFVFSLISGIYNKKVK